MPQLDLYIWFINIFISFFVFCFIYFFFIYFFLLKIAKSLYLRIFFKNFESFYSLYFNKLTELCKLENLFIMSIYESFVLIIKLINNYNNVIILFFNISVINFLKKNFNIENRNEVCRNFFFNEMLNIYNIEYFTCVELLLSSIDDEF